MILGNIQCLVFFVFYKIIYLFTNNAPLFWDSKLKLFEYLTYSLKCIIHTTFPLHCFWVAFTKGRKAPVGLGMQYKDRCTCKRVGILYTLTHDELIKECYVILSIQENSRNWVMGKFEGTYVRV